MNIYPESDVAPCIQFVGVFRGKLIFDEQSQIL